MTISSTESSTSVGADPAQEADIERGHPWSDEKHTSDDATVAFSR
jgi:hypothetical protein